MKPERILLLLVWLLLAAGFIVWAAGDGHLVRSLGIWLWLGAAGILGLPLLLWLIDTVRSSVRR
jgi:hypothetical protein